MFKRTGEYVPVWKLIRCLEIYHCPECKKLSFEELTGHKTFLKFFISSNNYHNDTLLLERKFKGKKYITRLK